MTTTTTPAAVLTLATATEYARAFFSTDGAWVSSIRAEWMPADQASNDDVVTVRGTYHAERVFPFHMDVWLETGTDGTPYLYGEY